MRQGFHQRNRLLAPDDYGLVPASTARRHATEIRTIVESTAVRTVSDDEFGAAAASWRELFELIGAAMHSARSYTRDQLPASLRQRHSNIGSTDQTALQALKDHSATIFNSIRDSLGDTLVIRRDQLVTQLLERLEEDRVVVVSGPAGHGKSVLGKHAVEIWHRDHFSFAFRAEEFATSHLDETLHSAQVGVGAEHLLALLAGQGRKLLVIESVERLLYEFPLDMVHRMTALDARIPLETLEGTMICTRVNPNSY